MLLQTKVKYLEAIVRNSVQKARVEQLLAAKSLLWSQRLLGQRVARIGKIMCYKRFKGKVTRKVVTKKVAALKKTKEWLHHLGKA